MTAVNEEVLYILSRINPKCNKDDMQKSTTLLKKHYCNHTEVLNADITELLLSWTMIKI